MDLTFPTTNIPASQQVSLTSNETIPTGYDLVGYTVSGTGSAYIILRNMWINTNHVGMNVTNFHSTEQNAVMTVRILLMKL